MTPTRVTVCKVNALRGEARKGVCYVGRAFAGWPASPWANPFKPKSPGIQGACQNTMAANYRAALAACLNEFTAYAAGKPDTWWADLWAACEHGRLPLGCFCFDGPADGGQHVCHAAILGAELNRRFIDGVPS